MDPRISRWLARDPDNETREEIKALAAAGDEAEIERRLGARLSFGTAGLRGVLGAGTQRMNRLVVRETTAGLGAYLLETIEDAKKRGVVVGFDARHKSRVFAEDSAAVLAGMDIRVHLFNREVPTPVCAFAVRDLGAAAGIMITASHNPPEYNGYKVYWQHGAQIIPPHDRGIAAAIERAAKREIPWRDPAQARGSKAIKRLGDAVTHSYLDAIASLSVHHASPARASLAIAYTPLHGVGGSLAEEALARAGFANVHAVESQAQPDPEFPTVRFPNPEEPGTMDEVLALATEVGADLACANDPDADRLAVAVRRPDGTYHKLSGDQIGALLAADLFANPPRRAVAGTTVVSSRLLGVMAEARGVRCYETLTGFKWIADAGFRAEAEGERFIFGYEEALGYTIGGVVRDKDGISALVAIAELAAACAERGETVLDRLESLYREHGLFLTCQRSLPLDSGGRASALGEGLRSAAPSHVAGRAVESIADVLVGLRRRADGREERLDLPRSDVLIYHLEGGARVVVRPSGTEPKLKCYYEVREVVAADEPFAQAEARAQAALAELAQTHQEELAKLSHPPSA